MAAPTFPKLNIFSQIKSESRGSSGGACEKCGSTLAFRVFSIFSLAFRAFILLSSVFRAMFSIWNSEPSSSSVWRSKPSSLLSYDVQSRPSQFDIQRCQFFRLTFKSTTPSQLQRSKSSFLVWHLEMSVLSYGVQSHHLLTTRHSESSLLLSYNVQSHLPQFWSSKPPAPYNSMFKAIIISQLRHSESSFSV